MTENSLPFIFLFSWLGFSLAFLLLAVLWHLSVTSGAAEVAVQKFILKPKGFIFRLTIWAFFLFGALGTASLSGILKNRGEMSDLINIAFLAGTACGLWMAWRMYFKKGVVNHGH